MRYLGRTWFMSLMATLILAGSGWNLLITKKETSGALNPEEIWVDSVFNSLTEDERLGQLFMIRAHSNLGPDHVAEVKSFIRDYHIGSMCFFQGTPDKQASLINEYQAMTKVPIMMAIDAEWGLGMRMKESTISFPHQLMLGAIQDNRLIYDMGSEIARQLKAVGIHVNFAPVVDVNNNPKNPVINFRSFGEDRLNVSVKSYMYAKGMQDNGVMACAKHFPGHGDTDTDSHLDLPKITHSIARLDSIELYPFKLLTEKGIGSMMVAHLEVPSLDQTLQLPTTLSKKVVTSLLKQKMGFKGLIFTDALEMKGVTKNFPCGEIEIRALEAGNDVLVLPEDLAVAFQEVKAAIDSGRLSRNALDERVKKVLRAKYRLGLSKAPEVISTKYLNEDLHNPHAEVLRRKLIKNALTLVSNKNQLIPFKNLRNKEFASLSIGSNTLTPFQKMLGNYVEMDHHFIEKIYSDDKKDILAALEGKDVVVVGIHGMSSKSANDFGLSPATIDLVKSLQTRSKVVLTVFGNPYSLKFFDDSSWLLEAYEDDDATQELAAQGLFGVFGFRGRLPVSVSSGIRFNAGVTSTGIFRLGYTLPAEVGMDAEGLAKVDTIAMEAIKKGATPSCVVLVARKGQVVYQKAFGTPTYKDKSNPVNTHAVYDLASITKVAATTLSVMKLHDEGKLDVQKPLSVYLPALDTTDKKGLIMSDVLAHRSGLMSWIPFYKNTLEYKRRRVSPSPRYYSTSASVAFSTPVAAGLFMKTDYQNAILDEIYSSKLYETRKYRYSDLGFYLLSQTVEALAGEGMDVFLEQNFYQELGLQTMMFNPWRKFPVERMVPTEEDRYFRFRSIQGYVHDMGAAMLGGVSGHAGLFSDANDLAIVFQMLLNRGFYGGVQYLSPETVRLFTTRCQDCSRRGLGFDMKETGYGKKENLPSVVSERAFGHTGFTGTCAWADPEEDLVYIFLSNRTYPSMRNYKINELDIRERIQAAIYQSITR